ncbi:cellulose synthase subunit BcsC-related outer membrane protein [Desulfosoma caldarium]|uniref:Tetratricopeptide repeat protein n=1 Tax=Desulfosoma caldarium TaxID=610254 RepID=A0A3N1UKJ1_9BACT|nr:cellulose synthase subunit BcsC-related outer membrane protein [Desulfosoma caldarium]ROQ89899.1 tetratricopeptide repeat protein [Desulfosoma caldarium]
MRRTLLRAVAVWLSWTGCLCAFDVMVSSHDTIGTVLAAAQEQEVAGVRDRASLQIAWWHFREGRYEKALALFEDVRHSSETLSLRQEAQWGMALCLDRLKRRTEAAALVKDLHDQGYHTKDTEKWIAQYRRDVARVQRNLFQERIRREAAAARDAESVEAVARFVEKNTKALRRCIAPEAFFEVAQALRRKGEVGQARRIQEKLLDCTTYRYALRLGVYAELLELMPTDDVLARLRWEKERPKVPASYREGLAALETEALRRKLFALTDGAEETESVAREILQRDPDDPDALLKLGWHAYHAGRFSEAESLFSRLHRLHPDREDAVLGLAHAYMAQKNFHEAHRVLEALAPPLTKEGQSALFRLHMEEGAQRQRAMDLEGAEASYRRAAELQAEDGAPWRALGWVLLEQGRFSDAANAFRKALNVAVEPNAAQGLLLSLERSGRFVEAHDVTKDLSRKEDAFLRQVAVEHFQRTGKEMQAALAAPHGAQDASGWSTLEASFMSRSGDDGTSRLKTFRLPWRVALPTDSASLWTFQVEGIHLDTDDPGQKPFVGSFGLSNGRAFQPLRWVTSRWVVSPSVVYVKEGAWNVRVEAGLTPLNGPVNSKPTVALEVSQPRWRLEAHRISVEDSLLSWIGQRDPYSQKTWGRVLRTGGSVAYSRSWPQDVWSTVRLGADHYGGKGVWQNFAVTGDASMGRNFSKKAGVVSLGGFVSAARYDRNSDFYTLGHGGYFSPSVFVMAGPTARFQTHEDQPWWLNVQASAGYLYYKTEKSPVYPRKDRPERYAEDRFSGLGYSGSFKVARLVAPRWAVGVHMDVDKSSGYTRWSAGAALTWFFKAHTTLGRTTHRYDAFFHAADR